MNNSNESDKLSNILLTNSILEHNNKNNKQKEKEKFLNEKEKKIEKEISKIQNRHNNETQAMELKMINSLLKIFGHTSRYIFSSSARNNSLIMFSFSFLLSI